MLANKTFTFILLLVFANSQSSLLSATSTDTDSFSNLETFRKAELGRHNDYRKLHGVPPLALNQSLNAIAQSYSKKLLETNTFTHSEPAKTGEYGENLFKTWSSRKYSFPPEGPSGSWYSEIQNYNFSTGQAIAPGKMIYHFTAMIWKEVSQVGFGLTYGPEKNGYAIYVVAIYNPTPNVFDSFKQNVLPIVPINSITKQTMISSTSANNLALPKVSAEETLNALRKTELDKHNEYRKKHGSPPLVINESLNSIAQAYATTLFEAQKGLAHSNPAKQGKYGENIYWGWGSPKYTYPTAAASVSWYDENKDYNYTKGEPLTANKVVGHFTAMVWKQVKSAGFGFVLGPENKGQAMYVVVNYYPPPNFANQYTTNVLRPLP